MNVCVVLLVILLAIYHNCCRLRNYLKRQAIVDPKKSAWQQLVENGDSSSFLLLTGLNRRAFYMLLDIVIPRDHRLRSRRRRRGRQWSLSAEGQLGLLLFYLGSTMPYKHLCLIFGITPSACSRILNKMLDRVVSRLRFHPYARVKFPNNEKMQQFASMIESREPSVSDVIGFMDGVSLTSECTDERITQNAYYCGYSCDTMVNNIFAYGPDGKVFFCAINYPGSWADGSVTARFLHHIKRRIGEYKICVDQGFPRSGEASGILVGPIPERSARRLVSSARHHDHLCRRDHHGRLCCRDHHDHLCRRDRHDHLRRRDHHDHLRRRDQEQQLVHDQEWHLPLPRGGAAASGTGAAGAGGTTMATGAIGGGFIHDCYQRCRQSSWRRYVSSWRLCKNNKSGGEKKAAKFYRLGRPPPLNLVSAKFYF